MKKFTIVFFLLFIYLYYNLIPNEDNTDGTFSALKTNNGIMFIYNANYGSFSLELNCKEVKELDYEELILLIDNKVFHLNTIPIDEFYKGYTPNSFDSLILSKHYLWEMDYSRSVNPGLYEQNLNVTNDTNGKLVFEFDYRIPYNPEDTASDIITHQLYSTRRVGNRVLLLSSVVTLNDSISKIREFLREAINSVQVKKEPFNLDALRDSLKLKIKN